MLHLAFAAGRFDVLRVRRLQSLLRKRQGRFAWVGDAYATGDGAAGLPCVDGLSYLSTNEESFALYYDTGPVDPANANSPVIDLQTAKLHD